MQVNPCSSIPAGCITTVIRTVTFIMRRASETSLCFLGFPRKKKPLHNGSYEHRVPKIKKKTLFCTGDVCVCDCV